MKRRNFLKSSVLTTGGLLVAPAFLQYGQTQSFKPSDKKLIVIQLSGGNDGLNTVIPYNNDIYYKLRSTIGIPKNEVLKVGKELGFHPALAPLRNLYDEGMLCVVNSVGYPNPVRSHFRSMDIWQSGSGATEHWETGWLGRYLDEQNSKGHTAIEVDDMLGMALKGENKKGLAMRDARRLHKIVQEPYFDKVIQHADSHHHDHNENLGYLYKTLVETKSSAQYIYEKSKIQKTKETYPQNALGRQLKTVAQMMLSGIDTQIYYVSMSGFDTHANQPNMQKRLLGNYAEAIEVFVKDLKQHGLLDQSLILTFSEFGRSISENASRGTDHGTANNLFVIGNGLKKQGFYNAPADLSNLDEHDDLKFEIDFRRIYRKNTL